MKTFNGINQFFPLATGGGHGQFPATFECEDGDKLNGANLQTAVEALTDCRNWLGWRAIDFQYSGTANYTPLGTVKWLLNGANGWDFRCELSMRGNNTLGGTTRVEGTTDFDNIPHFVIANPVGTANVGDNALTALGQAKAYLNFTTGGGWALHDRYNVATAALDASNLFVQVTFANGMADAHYCVQVSHDNTDILPNYYLRTTSGFRVAATNRVTGAVLDLSAITASNFSVTVFGRQ